MARRNTTGKSQTGRLRIVAGNWRSRLLDIADVPGLRPTSERIRETLFNWLAPEIHGKRCLDLFAGTGGLGLEALSRGAGSAVFVERSARAVHQLKANIEVLEAAQATVQHTDANEFLGRARAQCFDIVFLDPPFADDVLADLCRLIHEKDILADGGLVYLEQDRAKESVALPDDWHVLKDKTAGNVRYMLVQQERRQERNK